MHAYDLQMAPLHRRTNVPDATHTQLQHGRFLSFEQKIRFSLYLVLFVLNVIKNSSHFTHNITNSGVVPGFPTSLSVRFHHPYPFFFIILILAFPLSLPFLHPDPSLSTIPIPAFPSCLSLPFHHPCPSLSIISIPAFSSSLSLPFHHPYHCLSPIPILNPIAQSHVESQILLSSWSSK